MQLFSTIVLMATLPAWGADYAPRPDLDAGRYLKALADAETILQGEPGNALAWAAKSQALTALVRLPEATAAAQRAVELKPGLADALLARGLALGGLAVQQKNFSSLSRITNAMDDLRAAVAADPTLVTAWMTLGLAYEQIPGFFGGSTRLALASAESLKKVNGPRGNILQGTILAMEGKWGDALPCFNRALAAAPTDPEVIYAYLDALGSRETRKVLGDAPQRRQEAQEALRLRTAAGTRARPLTAICDALLDADRVEDAWRIAQEALPTCDAPSLLRMQLGKIAALSGRHLEAGLAALDQVLREPLEGGTGGYGSAHWRRGQVLKYMGRKAEARAAAEAALRLDPKDSKAQRLLKELS
ncbi:MAG: tetratricopeptide repeat protein [Holophaga sp.]|nr:tetratricopeptide repeat protein [Holophaga sp.]